ncbi:MAG TPA: glycosyltransferase family 4 protein [Anaerolineales bacterium]|nr:glycosyltransferase family 4 protein [Anaerolineales bacterium]
MKIGYLLQLAEELRQPPYTGPANHVRQVVQELIGRGHQVRLLFRVENRIWKSDDLQSFEEVGTTPLDHGLLRLIERAIRRAQSELHLPYLAFFESLRYALACRQELAGYELLFERFSWMAYGGMIAARWLKVPWVLEYNGNPLHDLESKGIAPAGLQRKIAVTITKRGLQGADHVVATGEGWRKSCVHDWGVLPEKVTVVENGTELTRLLQSEQLRSFQIAGSIDEPVQLVYLGGFYPWHGVEILLRAVFRAVRQGASLRLILIGSGVGFEAAKRLADELGLAGLVTFKGQLSVREYAPVLAGADIGLSPYCGWREYSGLKLFDYKAAGLGIIASGEEGNPATIEHGCTGWIVPPCDEDALLDAILHLCADHDLRKMLGRSARLEAEKLHGWDRTAQSIEQIFTDSLAG